STTPATTAAATADNGAGEAEQIEQPVAKIHVPDRELGDGAEEADESVPPAALDGTETAPTPKTKTRRGTRGGRHRKRQTATPAANATGGCSSSATTAAPRARAASTSFPSRRA